MKIKQIKVYEYSELSDKAKEYAHSQFKWQNDHPDLEYELKEHAKELLKHKGYKVENLHLMYSLSYSQGDGLTFDDTLLTIDGINIKIKQSGHYYHEYSNDFTFSDEETGEELDEKEEIVEELRGIMREIAKYGYEDIKHRESEECFIEICDANEYTFRENGTMENL